MWELVFPPLPVGEGRGEGSRPTSERVDVGAGFPPLPVGEGRGEGIRPQQNRRVAAAPYPAYILPYPYSDTFKRRTASTSCSSVGVTNDMRSVVRSGALQ